MPYADGTFDKVCTVNTLYFWPSPLENVREMRRVMKPGGRLVVAFRSRESLQRAAKKLLYGITLYDRSTQTSYGTITNFCDPDGNRLEILYEG